MNSYNHAVTGMGSEAFPSGSVRTEHAATNSTFGLFPATLTLLFMAAIVFVLSLAATAQAASENHASRGRASWYGTTAHGKQTANGEIYNRNALTAAHKGLPFGTVVRVHNLRNGRHVLVRVNDRGPFVEGRIVDVSLRAAQTLKMTSSGVVPVAVEVVANNKGRPLNRKNGFFLHLADAPGVMQAKMLAMSLENKLNDPVHIRFSMQSGRPAYALCLGPYDTFAKAQKDFLRLEKRKIPLYGIIEGPAEGGDIPYKKPPKTGAPRTASLPSDVIERLHRNGHASLDVASFLTEEKRLLLFTALKNLLPGFTRNSELFRLPYTALSGYIYLPS